MNDAAETSRLVKKPRAVEPAYPPTRLVKSVSQILLDAHAEAGRIVAAAQARADELLDEAKHASDNAATAATVEAGRRLRSMLTQFDTILASEQEQFARLVHEAGVSVATKLIGDAIDADPARLIRLINETVVQHAVRDRELEIRLHPDDAARIAPIIDTLRHDLAFANRVQIKPDPARRRGDVLIVSDIGRYEGGLIDVLRSLERRLG